MKHLNLTYLVVSFVTASLVVSPFAYAKDNGKGPNNDHGQSHVQASVHIEASTSTKDDSDHDCVRAFGHLIAPGWIKHNGTVNLGSECALPSGIARIFNFGRHGDNDHGTTTPPVPDTTAPIISNLSAATVRAHEVTIRWNTNENADSAIWLATSLPVNVGISPTVSRSTLVTDHRLYISGLASSTTYHAVVRSRDAAGNVSTSSEMTFTTSAAATTTPVVTITNAVTTIGTSTAHVTWTTNVNADSEAYYSTTSPVVIGAPSTASTTNSALTTSHSLDISGLATSTTYFTVLQSKDSLNNTATTGQFSFTTGI